MRVKTLRCKALCKHSERVRATSAAAPGRQGWGDLLAGPNWVPRLSHCRHAPCERPRCLPVLQQAGWRALRRRRLAGHLQGTPGAADNKSWAGPGARRLLQTASNALITLSQGPSSHPSSPSLPSGRPSPELSPPRRLGVAFFSWSPIFAAGLPYLAIKVQCCPARPSKLQGARDRMHEGFKPVLLQRDRAVACRQGKFALLREGCCLSTQARHRELPALVTTGSALLPHHPHYEIFIILKPPS